MLKNIIKKNHKVLLLSFLLGSFSSYSQNSNVTDSINVEVSIDSTTIKSIETDKSKVTGVAVSPAHFHLSIKPGEEKTITITVTNNTAKQNSFKISMVDFDMNSAGKSMFLPPSTDREYSLSRWSTVAPTFIELAVGEKKQISVNIVVPITEEGQKAAWTIVMVEQQVPRDLLDPTDKDGGTVAFGVVPTYAFGVFVYQNPPNVDNNNVDITNFKFNKVDSLYNIKINAKNIGDGIAYCMAYVDITNISTGFQKRLLVKRFTIVPGLEREFRFRLPNDLPKGDYIAVGVIDYKNAEEIKAAKTKFIIE
jgi:hypothetical protein